MGGDNQLFSVPKSIEYYAAPMKTRIGRRFNIRNKVISNYERAH